MNNWEWEDEYRFLTVNKKGYSTIPKSEIIEIYFGNPYNVYNGAEIKKMSRKLRNYYGYKEELSICCENNGIIVQDVDYDDSCTKIKII